MPARITQNDRRPRGSWRCASCAQWSKPDRFQCSCGAVKPWKRSGTHRLDCPVCPGYVYATVSSLETIGIPRCACGETFEPVDVELCLLLGLETARVRALLTATQNKESSQARKFGRRELEYREMIGTLNNMSDRAVAEARAERAQDARARRLAAIAPSPEPIPF